MEGVFSVDALTSTSGEIKASDIFAFAMSKEVSLNFDYPVHFDQCWFRANQQFVHFYRNDNEGKDPMLFVELWGED